MRWLVLTIAVIAMTGCARSGRAAGGNRLLIGEKVTTGAEPSSGVSSGTRTSQEFARFRVEVENLQVRGDGSVLLVLGYQNKTKPEANETLQIGLKRPAVENTLLFDDAGNSYKLGKAIGTSDAEERSAWATLDPGGSGAITLIFETTNKVDRKPRLFSFTSAQIEAYYGWRNLYNIVFRGIEAR